MSHSQKYTVSSMMGLKDGKQLLHIEARSTIIPEECYSQHYSYEQLPQQIKFVFHNLADVFVFMQRKGAIYFDQEQKALKLCLRICGQVKEYSLPLSPYFAVADMSKHKLATLLKQKKKIQEQFTISQEMSEKNLDQAKMVLLTLIKEKQEEQRLVSDLTRQLQELTRQTQQIEKEYEQRLIHIQNNPPVTKPTQHPSDKPIIQSNTSLQNKEVAISTQPPISHQPHIYQGKKKFWIQDIAKLKKDRLQELKAHINSETKFEEQLSLSINFIKLSKMVFVELFVNLQVLDLSNNNILFIEGVSGLTNLLKLNLSYNKIATLSLPALDKLVQLILRNNLIRKIQNIFHLACLQVLNLNQNKIESVPDQMSRLGRLVELRLYKNRVTAISEKVLLLKNLKIFSIARNKCNKEGSKGQQIISRLAKNGVKVNVGEVETIEIQ